MRYQVLACDYDGTLATDGAVPPKTLAALELLHRSGRKAVLVTGRIVEDLMTVCPIAHWSLFERIVAENGALLYSPSTRQERLLAEPPPQAFLSELKAKNVAISVGRTIVATKRTHEATVRGIIRDMGLDLHVIANKDDVMVLPSKTDKATGLMAALAELKVSERNVVGVGDAENDVALLDVCGYGVAVANALPALKKHADLVTRGASSAGVVELIDALIESDLHRTASSDYPR